MGSLDGLQNNGYFRGAIGLGLLVTALQLLSNQFLSDLSDESSMVFGFLICLWIISGVLLVISLVKTISKNKK